MNEQVREFNDRIAKAAFEAFAESPFQVLLVAQRRSEKPAVAGSDDKSFAAALGRILRLTQGEELAGRFKETDRKTAGILRDGYPKLRAICKEAHDQEVKFLMAVYVVNEDDMVLICGWETNITQASLTNFLTGIIFAIELKATKKVDEK